MSDEEKLKQEAMNDSLLNDEPTAYEDRGAKRGLDVDEDDDNNNDNNINAGRPKNASTLDDEELDDGEDEDEDEEDEAPGKRRKRRRANQFIDIEAEVDDEEEDELDEEDEEAELLREQFISDDRGEIGDEANNQDDRLHRQFDRRRQEAEDQDAEQLAETLKQRYRKTHTVYRGDTADGTVSQKLLMPSINDPPIYAIRVNPGREKDLVRKLYEKKRTLARKGVPLDILTVFQRDSFKGYIYIEATKPEAIERALNGVPGVYMRNRLLVPVGEYPDLLKQVKSTDVELVPGIYVRLTRGKYKGDLAIVDNLSENGLDVRCKLVPRLDYGKNDDFDKDGRRIKLKLRPIPRLFSEQEARMYDGEGLQPGRGTRTYFYRGDEYIDGFLFKDFKLQFVQTNDVHPTLEELDRFQTGGTEEGLDLAAVAASIKNKNDPSTSKNIFQAGDKVEIRRGELARTIGKVTSCSLNEVSITVTDSGDANFVNQAITVPASDLRKVFVSGDHVRVVQGKHADETGLVIKTDGDNVVLLSDQTQEDIRLFANYLIKATDSYTDSFNSIYSIKDMVQLNASTVGVIVKTEKDIFQILTSEGRLVKVKPSGIASKLNLSKREQAATDRNGSTIRVGDTVKESLGDKKREGSILHIYKNALFIESHEIIENLGIFTTNCINVTTISTKDSMVSRSLGPDLSKMNPNLKMQNPIAALGLRAKQGGRDKLLSKDVVVTGGNYKGLKGKVVDADDTFVRIELHTKAKKIKVGKNNISVFVRGEAVPYLRFIGGGNSGPSSSSRPEVPAYSSSGNGSSWGSTGQGGGQTSAWGGATAWGGNGGGGRTPAVGNASTWGGGNASSWGRGAGNASTWNGGNASTWGGGNASAWGGANNNNNNNNNNNGGGNSNWGGNKGGNSAWGASGSGSTWGNGSGSTWGKGGNRSAWGKQ
ncbi:transcription elongation factor spt5 [Scheffersomyces spartinae]|uniref:Transcription elongation factor SPT5 n=1 Tax=Scheffersomyces spartinae TaxID=45513 RepID=A0A9P7VAV8_9ASCO|nr:transcription elongation factor spt5 [Scheffersomyces spartinae]KAG7194603.1 transcription elongation factor spt5 [Scheffersomyces spartinae]